MPTIFLCSDHHYNHENIITFLRSDGTPLRDFSSVGAMNETIIARHNSVVRPGDKVYFLGDVTMPRTAGALEFLDRMNGEKILIKGNHDLCKAQQYLKYFKDIRAYHQLDGMILSHIPIHPESLSRWRRNIHGHLHANHVMLDGVPDPRYINVCMEQIDYTPISLEQLKEKYNIND